MKTVYYYSCILCLFLLFWSQFMLSWVNFDFNLQVVKFCKRITKSITHCYIVTVLQVSFVKKFIKKVNPYVFIFSFTSPLLRFLIAILNVKQNYIHTFIWKFSLKRHLHPSYELQISLNQQRCALNAVSILDGISWVTGSISNIQHSGLS